VHTFSAEMYGTVPYRPSLIAKRLDVGSAASALVLPEIGVLDFDDQFLQTYSQVGPILSAVRLSRSWEEGLWDAS
jgi:hypothetical protein